jgi:uncharacterized membrane protein
MLEVALALPLLALSLWLAPWRMLRQANLATPWLASLTLTPLIWAIPFLQHMPLALHWSGAPLVTLLLGWPLAVPTLSLSALALWLLAPVSGETVLQIWAWQAILPATFTLLIGAALRRWVVHHPLVYILGRGFFGTVLSLFLAFMLGQWSGLALPNVSDDLTRVAFWLMAWGDAFMTGMLCAIFVAFRPQWLATWSDPLYLRV